MIPTTHWLSFQGTQRSRIDHSTFGKRVGRWLDIEVRKPSQHIRIDHNYFHDRETHGRNGAETIRVDGGRGHSWDAYTVIEHNLFERCSGAGEIISIKSHRNTIRANTFRDSFGPGRAFSVNQWHRIDPKLVGTAPRGVFRLSKASPAIDHAVGHFPGVVDDIEGQGRRGPKDIGADEYHPSTTGPLRPLMPDDVGPLSGTSP